METIFDYIKREEINYTKPIDLEDGWHWSMKDHLRKSFLYKNSQFLEDNENRKLRPNKNIVLAIRNVQNRTEGFDVKDIELYIDDSEEYYKSFLVKKYHNKWAPENQIDTFIDDMVDCYGDYGGVLVRDAGEARPVVTDLRSLAFCNQRNILADPFCFKHTMSQAELRDMEASGWGLDSNGANISIEQLITLCKDKPEIEIYELHGTLPYEWLNDGREGKKDVRQIQIVAYYVDQNNQEQGVTLFKKREPKLPFKFLARDKIVGRALGRGGIEELFEAQIWTNWNEIKITEMLEAASKVILLTDDPSILAKHPSGLKGIDNLEMIETKLGGKGIWQMDNTPRNLVAFNNATDRWVDRARELGSANETLLGETPSAGTPFKLFEAQNIEAKGMHIFRQGQLATFMDEIYRDWILPRLGKELVNDHRFMVELSADEMMEISEQVAENQASQIINEQVLSGELPSDKEEIKQQVKNDFLRKGNKRFINILKDEMSGVPLGVMTNIAGKQKNLAMITDKLSNIMRQFFSTPQIRQDPEMVKLLNVILESSGLSPIMFGGSQPVMQNMPANIPSNMPPVNLPIEQPA